MAEITLITGGTRSGKSSFAQNMAERISTEKDLQRIFIATSPSLDSEMEERIKRHKEERAGKGWKTIEEERNILSAITDEIPRKIENKTAVVLLDCITLWINNLLYRAEKEGRTIDDSTIYKKSAETAQQMLSLEHRFILVSNEVGLGIVPDNAAARRYRDLVGTANQCLASFAEEVILVSCGLPLYLKKEGRK